MAAVRRAAGIVLRFADPQDFYVVEADALAGRVRLLSIVNGERREIADRAAPLVVGEAQTLKVKAIDDHFAVTLDGKDLFEATGRRPHRRRAVSASGAGPTVDTSFGDFSSPILD